MKKIYGFAALCAAMTLASCSNNDEPVVNPVVDGPTETGYIAVNIVPTDAATRAEVYDKGSQAESYVSEGVIIAFDNAGKVVDVVDFIPTQFQENTESQPNVSHVSKNILEVKYPKFTTGSTETSIKDLMCVLNLTQAELLGLFPTGTTTLVGQSVQDVRQRLTDYTSYLNRTDANRGKFIMSNSVEDGTTIVYTTPVKEVFHDLDDAQKTANITNIYVERVVGRVDYKTGDEFAEAPKTGNVKIENNQVSLDIHITGVTVANAANSSWLVKDLSNKDKFPFPSTGGYEWNPESVNRSHWSNTPTTATPGFAFNNSSWTAITKASNNNSDTDIKFDLTASAKPFYLNENTNQDQPSCLLITATLGEGQDIYQLVGNGRKYDHNDAGEVTSEIGKYYYSLDNLKTEALNYLEADGFRKKVTTEEAGKTYTHYKSLELNDIELVQSTAINTSKFGLANDAFAALNYKAHGYDGYLQVKSTVSNLVHWEANPDNSNKEEYVDKTVNQINKLIWDEVVYHTVKEEGKADVKVPLKKYRVYKWNAGKCYYYVPIQASVVGFPGVVRNHIYDLTINSITGMGVPVFNPSDEIVPEPKDPVNPDDPSNYYINAAINILSWTYYVQNVNFGEGDIF